MSRIVVAVRHAHPEAPSGYASDDLIPLCDEGRIAQEKVVKALNQAGYIPTKILTSPLLRAKQTAEIIADYFGVNYEVFEALGSYFDRELLMSRLQYLDDHEVVYLVGHAPTLAELVNDLAGEQVLHYGLSKSCAAVIQFDQRIIMGSGRFLEHFSPS
ncbi:MAG: phosphohistidine phosphatase SixA [Chlamydiales bacterium]